MNKQNFKACLSLLGEYNQLTTDCEANQSDLVDQMIDKGFSMVNLYPHSANNPASQSKIEWQNVQLTIAKTMPAEIVALLTIENDKGQTVPRQRAKDDGETKYTWTTDAIGKARIGETMTTREAINVAQGRVSSRIDKLRTRFKNATTGSDDRVGGAKTKRSPSQTVAKPKVTDVKDLRSAHIALVESIGDIEKPTFSVAEYTKRMAQAFKVIEGGKQ